MAIQKTKTQKVLKTQTNRQRYHQRYSLFKVGKQQFAHLIFISVRIKGHHIFTVINISKVRELVTQIKGSRLHWFRNLCSSECVLLFYLRIQIVFSLLREGISQNGNRTGYPFCFSAPVSGQFHSQGVKV